MAILQDPVGLTNEDLRKIRLMRPGTAIDLQVAALGAIKRLRTEFVGMDGTRCMIIRFPDESKWGNLRDFIFSDKSLVIRYILEDETGEIIAFKVKVTLVLTKPSHLIFTSFPLSIQSHDLRAEPRAQTRASVNLRNDENNMDIAQCLVRDISLKGCRISIDRSSPGRPVLKQQITMEFTDAEGNALLLKGTVMNSKSDEVTVYFGIKFDTPEAEVAQLLQKMMLAVS